MNISIHKTVALIAAVGSLYLAKEASAQQTQSSTDSSKVYNLGEVVISASRFEESPETVGRNVTVITRQEIQGSVYTSVAGILAEQQSLHAVGNRQTPGSNQTAFLRNSNSNHYVVMIDGIRISDPSSNNNGVDLSELSLAGVERIEIVRGSHSTLYGSSAIGGVINIITQAIGRTGIHANLTTQHGLLSGSTYSTSNNTSINLTLENGFYANLSAFQQHTPGFDATVDTSFSAFNPQDQDGFNKLDLMGKAGYQTSSLELYGAYRRVGQASDIDQGAFMDDDNAEVDFHRNLFRYGGAYSFTDRFSVNFDGAWSDLSRDFVNDSSVVDADGNYDGTYTETNGEGTLLQNELTASWHPDQFRLLAGVGTTRQTMNTRTYTFARAFGYESTTDLDSLNLKETINSVFLHAKIRGSLLSNRLDNVSLVLGSRIARHNQFGTHWTYEINPQVQISASTFIYGAVTTGFNAPSLYQLHAPARGFGAYTNMGNESLGPETSISYELGWKQTFSNIVQLHISLFRTQVQDVIEYVYLWDRKSNINDLGSADYRGDTFLNLSRQNISGLELSVEVHPISSLSLSGNISYTQSKLVFSPEDIDESYTGGHHVQIFESGMFVNDAKTLEGLTRRPGITASFKMSYQINNKLSLNLNSRFVGNRDDIYYSSALGPYGALDRSKVNGYNLTDLGAGYKLNDDLTLGIEAENIFNTEYTEINGYRTRGRGVFAKASISL